ncbi:MAG: glycoside hydrolase family 92 protein, partial [Bacteroidales bacterium]|nr:glycoside hydrolase family 92 protein [Bacteroidales bacterium]
MSKYLTAGILLFLVLIQACNKPAGLSSQSTERLTAWVDPFIGTGFHGHTFPGAAFPFGQVQVSPDNGTQGWDWCSGYHYSDSVIAGFSHLHLSGTGIGDLCDISFLPLSCEPEIRKGESNRDFLKRYAAKFTHENEYAEPGYYSVMLGNDIKVEITVTERVGFQKYVFPEQGPENLLINLGFAINWDKPYKTEISLADSFTVTGVRLSHGWAEDQHVFFVTRFSEPVKSWSVTEIGGKARTAGIFRFAAKELLVKTALSSVSIENAIENLDSSAPGWDFGAVKNAASDAWEKELSKITIKAPGNDQKKIFYSALYHTMIAPSLFSDENGEFKGVKGDVQKAEGYKRYTVFSLWDTYRALHPLFTIIQGDRVNDMVKSMLDHFRQTGLLPVWELEGNETFCMVGNHAIS